MVDNMDILEINNSFFYCFRKELKSGFTYITVFTDKISYFEQIPETGRTILHLLDGSEIKILEDYRNIKAQLFCKSNEDNKLIECITECYTNVKKLSGQVSDFFKKNKTNKLVSVNDLELNVRILNAFAFHGITDVNQLLELGRKKLLKCKNFGYKSLRKLECVLEKEGFLTSENHAYWER